MALAKLFAAGFAVIFGCCVTLENAHAQFANPVPPPPPVFNPSRPYVLPQTRQTPVSPNAPRGLSGSGALLQQPPTRAPCSVRSGRPCHPSFCGVFHRGPCFPEYLPPIGQYLRLTIVSTDENDQADKPADADGDNELDSIGAMYAALRACWVPPPKDEAVERLDDWPMSIALGEEENVGGESAGFTVTSTALEGDENPGTPLSDTTAQ